MVIALLFAILVVLLAMGGRKLAGRLLLILVGIAATIGTVLWLFAPAA
jgi:hypothetical protein